MDGSYLIILFRFVWNLLMFVFFLLKLEFDYFEVFFKVVAIAVFLALGFAFYVFFAPFVVCFYFRLLSVAFVSFRFLSVAFIYFRFLSVSSFFRLSG